jgi:MFS family permease
MADESSKMEVQGDDDDSSSSSSRLLEKKNISNRRLLMFCCSMYTFFFVGSFFGWGPMQLLLEENGSFAWKCENSQPGDEPCADQTAALLSVGLTGQATQIVSPLLGLLSDRKGAKYNVFLMTGVLWTGLVLLAINAAHQTVLTDRLLFLAFSFLGLATMNGGILTIQTGLYWQGHTKSRVIFILNALFDAGGLTYLFLWYLGSELGLGFFNVIIGFFALSIVIMSFSLYFWTVARPEEEEEEKMTFKEEEVDPKEESRNGNEDEAESSEINKSVQIQMPVEDESSDPVEDESSDYVLLTERTTRQQLGSSHFILLCIFFGIHSGQNQWNLTTQRDFLAYLGDDQVGNKYLTIFTLLTPASILGLPFVDKVILRFGFSGGLQCINLLALVYNVVKLSSSNLNVQIIGFVFFSFYRCFLYGVTFSFLPTMIGQKLIGKASGWMYTISGLAALLNIPLSQVAVKSFDGNFFIPNLIVTFLMVPCAFAIFQLNRLMKKEKQIRNRRHTLEMERLRRSYGGFLLKDQTNDTTNATTKDA